MRVTQKDIANKLQISQSLVAGVLGARKGIWVSEENRQRIMDAARELDYRPNLAARALRRGKTDVVACVFFGSAGFTAVVEKLADELAVSGYDLLVKVVVRPDQAALRLQDLAAGGRCDAILLWGLEDEIEEPGAQLAARNVPFVVKGRVEEAHPDWPQADFDHEAMMDQAVSHLRRQGRRRIAYLGYNNDLVYSRKLREGFLAAMRAAAAEDCLMAGVRAVGSSLEETERMVEEWLRVPEEQQPDAIVVGAGSAAWQGIERALARRGKRIGLRPSEMGVAGLGGTPTPLWFGEGYAYPEGDLVILAGAVVDRLLMPLLAGARPDAPILRLLPELKPQRSMRFNVECLREQAPPA